MKSLMSTITQPAGMMHVPTVQYMIALSGVVLAYGQKTLLNSRTTGEIVVHPARHVQIRVVIPAVL